MPQRRHFRSSGRPTLTHQVIVKIVDRSPQESFRAITRDISTGGMFIYTDRSFKEGDAVEVALTSPSTWEPLTLKARVCRIVSRGKDRPGIGLQFVEVKDPQLVALINLTTSLDFES